MTNTTTTTKKEAPLWLKQLIAIIAGALLAIVLFALLLNLIPTVKADVVTLQESVQIAQADYDLSQSQAKAGIIQACETWKGLALAKADLAIAMKINSDLNKDTIATTDCKKVESLVPASF